MNEQIDNPTQTQATEQTQVTPTPDQNVQTQNTDTATPNAEQAPTTQATEQETSSIPESADAYTVAIDGFDFDSFKQNNGEVLKSFHEAGLSNDQLTAVVKAYDQHVQVDIDALQQEWGADFQNQVNLASNAVKAAGLSMDQIDSPTFGVRLAAWVGKQIQEDLPPQNTQQNGSESIEQLMMSEAYDNASHPDHKRVTKQVNDWYAKQYPEN